MRISQLRLYSPVFLGPVFQSKTVFDRQKWVTAKELSNICFKKNHPLKDCRLFSTIQKMEKKICGVNDCKGQHTYLLHTDHNKVTVNIFPDLEEDDEEEETPGEKQKRGIREGGRMTKT